MIYDHLAYLLASNSAISLVDRRDWAKVQEERDLAKNRTFYFIRNG